MRMWCLPRPEEDITPSRAGGAILRLLWGLWELNPGPLQKQKTHLNVFKCVKLESPWLWFLKLTVMFIILKFKNFSLHSGYTEVVKS